jgi:dihydropyrimidinase
VTRPTYDVSLRNGRVVIAPLGLFDVDLAISGGRIAAIMEPGTSIDAGQVIDVGGKVVLPGVIDPHTHIGYAGHRGMPLEALDSQFDSESGSALIGGVTTILNTYRNPSPYLDIFDAMRLAGVRNSRVDFSFNLGILNDEHVRQIPEYYREYGITSFKFYMAYRGGDAAASGNANNRYSDGLLFDAMRLVARIPGGMVMVHAENIDIIDHERQRIEQAGRMDLAAWTDSRPDLAEAESIRRALYLGEQAGCTVYVPHVSCLKGLLACVEHRARGTSRVYVEVCPHHLTYTKDSLLGILGKVNPPLRAEGDRDALWQALAAHVADTVGSDHAAMTRAMKGKSIWEGAPGLAGVATLLPVLLNGVYEKRLSLLDVALATSYGPAKAFGLYPRKGSIAVGSDADLTVVDVAMTRAPTTEYLRSSADHTVYEGLPLRGWPVLTMVRGKVQMEDGRLVGEPGDGAYVPRFASGHGRASSVAAGVLG